MKIYASRLTKEDLIKNGITLVTEDGLVFKGEEQFIPSICNGGYLAFNLYAFDEAGNKIKVPIKRQFKGCKKVSDTYIYKHKSVGLHRLMWAWFYNEVPEGMIVDHINNQHCAQEDYHISNLQLLTQAENIAKERPVSTREIKCKLNKPRSFYEDKLAYYEAEYEQAKKDGDANKAHKLRADISNIRARLRYWDAHEEERKDLEAYKEAEKQRLIDKKQSVKDRRLLTEWKEFFKEKGNKKMWRELIRTIKAWDTLDSKQKEHVFEILQKTFGSPWALDSQAKAKISKEVNKENNNA